MVACRVVPRVELTSSSSLLQTGKPSETKKQEKQMNSSSKETEDIETIETIARAKKNFGDSLSRLKQLAADDFFCRLVSELDCSVVSVETESL